MKLPKISIEFTKDKKIAALETKIAEFEAKQTEHRESCEDYG